MYAAVPEMSIKKNRGDTFKNSARKFASYTTDQQTPLSIFDERRRQPKRQI